MKDAGGRDRSPCLGSSLLPLPLEERVLSTHPPWMGRDPKQLRRHMRIKSIQSYPTLCDPMDCSPSGSSVRGIPQGRILERVAMPSSRGFSPTHGLNPSFLRLLLWSHLGSLRHHVERIASSLHSLFVSTTNKHFFLPAQR